MNDSMQFPSLTHNDLKLELLAIANAINTVPIAQLYGVTDGKAIGTYVEHLVRLTLNKKYQFQQGNSASGIDFPSLNCDLKVTSIRQPQSSSPYRDASQKIYGLGYDLALIVYDKDDDHSLRTSQLTIKHLVYVASAHTADYQTTFGILEILRRQGNEDDLVAFLEERNLPLDEVGRLVLAQKILRQPPTQGYLTISNALQWRLQYSRLIAVSQTQSIEGIINLLG